jgi:hypothetical protein
LFTVKQTILVPSGYLSLYQVVMIMMVHHGFEELPTKLAVGCAEWSVDRSDMHFSIVLTKFCIYPETTASFDNKGERYE